MDSERMEMLHQQKNASTDSNWCTGEDNEMVMLAEVAHNPHIASEVNAAILKSQNQENTAPKVSTLLKLILWAQDKLNKKNAKFPKMIDLANATIEDK